MRYVHLDEHGTVDLVVSTDDDPGEGYIAHGHAEINDWFEDNALFVAPPAPAPYYTWSSEEREWQDRRTLKRLQDRKWAEIKGQRDRIEFGGFEWDGSTFDTDQLSQSRITSTALAATLNPQATFDWTLADNTTRTLTAAEFVQMATSMLVYVETLHATSRTLREQINDATTREEVDAVQWPD